MIIIISAWLLAPFIKETSKLITLLWALFKTLNYITDSRFSLLQLNIDFVRGVLITLSAFVLILINLSAPPIHDFTINFYNLNG